MNRVFVHHLLAARHHLREAAISLAPPRARDHLRVIDREARALIVECLSYDAADSGAETKAKGSRRIDIKE